MCNRTFAISLFKKDFNFCFHSLLLNGYVVAELWNTWSDNAYASKAKPQSRCVAHELQADEWSSGSQNYRTLMRFPNSCRVRTLTWFVRLGVSTVLCKYSQRRPHFFNLSTQLLCYTWFKLLTFKFFWIKLNCKDLLICLRNMAPFF